MTIIIQSDIQDEFLSKDEIKRLTGCSNLNATMKWLTKQDWQFSVGHKNEIIIGRWYARLKLAGLSLDNIAIEPQADLPKFDKVS